MDGQDGTFGFTVIGDHLAQHPGLSLVAIGIGVRLQSMPAGTPVDVETLSARFPDDATDTAAALTELEVHGFLRRESERTPDGRTVTHVVFCHQ
ncbi:hypothetical protein [Streptomyces sp. DSM 15324]|uniref:hypothetical protein n=1 Tax=Streptomyces sp. DSM 15324 TaxID=1739111 RepID=UPI00074A8908|nr:hypothetical protein [Streptomyces sp. DSM 15324]KUO11753.1 hypothetical protein AQJ58_11330 [Streptomyces sp. DSM 15324]